MSNPVLLVTLGTCYTLFVLLFVKLLKPKDTEHIGMEDFVSILFISLVFLGYFVFLYSMVTSGLFWNVMEGVSGPLYIE